MFESNKYIRIDKEVWRDLKVMSAKLEISIKTLAEKYIRQGLEKEKEEKNH